VGEIFYQGIVLKIFCRDILSGVATDKIMEDEGITDKAITRKKWMSDR
jgi:hypothetical protein